ncbi:hypothetical protein [Microbacterium sp. NPDC091662]|uniref:hypothetical protein n=1 Tax=Microbacterium sp. NPDC091662 TaxID=3364211 RepID=UPI00382D6B24
MRFPRLLTCFLAVSALVLGTVVPATAATASVLAAGTSVARNAGDPAATGMVKTTLAGFEAGNIISDAVFTDKNTMSEAQIQAFFNSKVSSCQSGYVCIKDFSITSVTRPADAYCKGYTGAANESAARIIYRVAQSCNINPQVLIVMLQKEQGLITHTWPSAWRYNIALGQGCPDTAPCDPNYIGFFHQIYGAARQMQIYMEGKWFQWYAPGKTWNILYNPNANCGSSPVYVANKATSALYYYTPYQPNPAALRAGYGEGDGCSAYGNRNFYNYFTDWFGSTQGAANNPFGNIELVQAAPGKFQVSGWAIDPNTTDPIAVHVYVASAGTAITANVPRADVGAAYPGSGNNHGFSATVPAIGSGVVSVCIYAMNSGPGANVLLGCRDVESKSGVPLGAMTAKSTDAGIRVTGWALDPDTVDPATVHVYVDNVGVAITADKTTGDVPAALAEYGTKRGFDTTIPASAGSHSVCVYGINVGPGVNVSLGCTTVQASTPGIVEKGRAPIGALEAVTVSGNTASVTGWTLDPDTASPITVHLYVGATGTAYTADKARADVGAANPGYGDRHGFAETLTLPVGTSTICAYGINAGPGGHTLLGCKTATVNAPGIVEKGRAPIGALEAVTVSGNTASVTGWTLDPDTASPITVHLYVGATGTAYTADKARADVGAANPGYGDRHGFAETLTLPVGTSTICAYGINAGPGGHTLLGCKTATVNAPGIVEKGRAPIGALEAVTVSGNTASVTGWTLDPDTASPITVHLYVGATGTAYTADKARADVGAANPGYGDQHGFAETLTLPVGTSTICAYGINAGPGGHTLLGCKTATVAPPTSDAGRAPFGNFESAAGTPGTITVTGWAIDPDTKDPISVHIYVGAVGLAYWADKERGDVGAAYPASGSRHGFSQQITVSPGTYSVCAYAINNGAGGHTLLGCRNVAVG